MLKDSFPPLVVSVNITWQPSAADPDTNTHCTLTDPLVYPSLDTNTSCTWYVTKKNIRK